MARYIEISIVLRDNSDYKQSLEIVNMKLQSLDIKAVVAICNGSEISGNEPVNINDIFRDNGLETK